MVLISIVYVLMKVVEIPLPKLQCKMKMALSFFGCILLHLSVIWRCSNIYKKKWYNKVRHKNKGTKLGVYFHLLLVHGGGRGGGVRGLIGR